MVGLDTRSSVEVFHTEADVTFGAWKEVFLVVWKKNTTSKGVAKFKELLDRYCQAKPQGIGMFNIILESARVPSADIRKALADVVKTPRISLSVATMEGKGFRASAARGFIAGLSIVSKHPYPHKVFGTVDESSEWFANEAQQKFGWAITPAQLEGVVKEFLKKAS